MAIPYTLIYVAISTYIIWISALKLEKNRSNNKWIIAALIIVFLLLAGMKYVDFLEENINSVAGFFTGRTGSIQIIKITAALGVSYYTLSLVSYLMDVKWGLIEPEKNFLKLFLFTCYFPKMISGPICKWNPAGTELFRSHEFDLSSYAGSSIRILYGVFLKIVMAERLAILVNTVFENAADLSGLVILAGCILFTIQLYCDFSGCMHIILGTSQLFGIVLPENFKNPFFSFTVQEWWQRWHITLGQWTKEYILYPSLKSSLFASMRSKLQLQFGKKKAKKVITYMGMMLVWLYIGLWHGGDWKFLIMGLYFWAIIMMESEGVIKNKKRLISVVRTILLAAIGNLFFYSSSLKEWAETIACFVKNIAILPDYTVFWEVGISKKGILGIALGLIFVSGIEYVEWSSEKPIYQWIQQKNTLLKWSVIYMILLVVLIFGVYGEQYETSAFIYQLF